MSVPRILAAGDSALVVEFDARIDPLINARAIALADAIQSAALGGVRDVVPTYRSVAVYFDPLRTDYEALVARVEREALAPRAESAPAREAIRIPVCYGGTFGPDLPSVAAFAGLSEQEVISAHAAGTYRVFMVGFVPGFAYMGIVDARIAMPGADRVRWDRRRADGHLSGGDAGWLATDRPHACEALRSAAAPAVSCTGRRRRAVLRD